MASETKQDSKTTDGWVEWEPLADKHRPWDAGEYHHYEIQFYSKISLKWKDTSSPCWVVGTKYRYRPRCRPEYPQPLVTPASLPDDATARNEYPMADGLLDYFPNALAEVSKLSFLATQQHHPDKGMHWDRSKSTDHANKIIRHLVDRDTVDDKGIDHWAMVCWRALAGYQEYLEKKHGLRPSRASRNVG